MHNVENWIKEEFREVPFSDERHVKRLEKIANNFFHFPDKTIPEAMGSASELKGAYRFFRNKRINSEAILMTHREKTLERIKKEDVVLIVEDTTTIDYKTHVGTEGLGTCTQGKDSLGLLNHTSMAVSDDGIPLGILNQTIWTRDKEEYGKTKDRAKKEIKDKESNKWINGLEKSTKGISKSVKTVTVCDREADIYDFIASAVKMNQDVLVRIAQKHRLVEEEGKNIINEIEKSPERGELITKIPRDPYKKNKEREITLSIKYCEVNIKPPKNQKEKKEDIKVSIVLGEEKNVSDEKEKIYWLLLTTIPVTTLEEAIEKIRWYKQRWKIERYFYTLKQGCKIEELQLQSIESLENAISIYAVIAWKILCLKYESEGNEMASCDVVLEKNEWEALYCVTNNTPIPPKEPPKLSEAILMIAKLGGYLGRNGDAKPGVKVIWRGLSRLHYIAEGWLIAHLPIPNDVGKV